MITLAGVWSGGSSVGARRGICSDPNDPNDPSTGAWEPHETRRYVWGSAGLAVDRLLLVEFVECWQWNYKLDVYSSTGRLVAIGTVGHVVCGQVGCNGEEPTCYNKMTTYGTLEGPKPCASFRPPESGNPIEIGPENRAKGFTVKRSELEEHCYCGPVAPPSSLPKQK